MTLLLHKTVEEIIKVWLQYVWKNLLSPPIDSSPNQTIEHICPDYTPTLDTTTTPIDHTNTDTTHEICKPETLNTPDDTQQTIDPIQDNPKSNSPPPKNSSFKTNTEITIKMQELELDQTPGHIYRKQHSKRKKKRKPKYTSEYLQQINRQYNQNHTPTTSQDRNPKSIVHFNPEIKVFVFTPDNSVKSTFEPFKQEKAM